MANIFTAPSKAVTAQQFATCLPDGRAWANKNVDDSNIRKLINGVSVPFNILEQIVQVLDEEFRVDRTYDLLGEWEESVGIPDECLMTSTTLDSRRKAVLRRLRKKPLVTLKDIQDFVSELFPSIQIEIKAGTDYFTFEYDFELPFLGDFNEKFILVVEISAGSESFEYSFEFPFVGGIDTTKLQCVLNKVVPSEVYVIITEKGTI